VLFPIAKPEPTVECSANVMTVCIQSEEEDEENTDDSGEALKTNIASNVEQDNLHLSVTPMCHEVSRTTTHNNTCYIIDMKKCDAIQSEVRRHFKSVITNFCTQVII